MTERTMPRGTPQVLLILGTRPEAIKLAPVIAACQERTGFDTSLCSTDQHQELLDPFLEFFNLDPQVRLGLMQASQTPAEFLSRALGALDQVLAKREPCVVVVQGDTATAAAGAIAAFLRRIPVVHVEAGLRSHRLDLPFPEEFLRRAITLAAAVHCAPTARSAQALRSEGVPEERIVVTGNPVVDAARFTAALVRDDVPLQEQFAAYDRHPLVLITCHRRENFGPPLERVCRAIATLAQEHPHARFLFPVHLNPAVGRTVRPALQGIPNVRLVSPLDYPTTIFLLARAAVILSDSGGLQEESASLGTPMLVLRDTTERPEALETGHIELVGTDPAALVARGGFWLRQAQPFDEPRTFPPTSPFGDGRAGERIAKAIQELVQSVTT